MDDASVLPARTRQRRGARVSRLLGTLLIVVGLGLLGWGFTVWKWGDPFTAIYTTLEQRQLDAELATLGAHRPVQPPPPTTETPAEAAARVQGEARAFRRNATPGDG